MHKQRNNNPKTAYLRKSYFNRLNIFSFLILTTLFTGCSFPGVYKINVQQGTIITQDMLDQLKPGMSPKQVHFVLGTPSAPNTFSTSTDTYYYSFQKAGKDTRSQKIIIHYDDNQQYTHHTGTPLKSQPAY